MGTGSDTRTLLLKSVLKNTSEEADYKMPLKLNSILSLYSFAISVYFHVLLVVLLINFQPISYVSGAQLNQDGGYEISLAIRAGNYTPGVNYLGNVKNTIRTFSNELYRSTKGRFYIKRAEILIPSSWDTPASDDTLPAASQSFGTADLRVSVQFQDPHAENPNLCGVVGSHIEVPLQFFEKLNESPYGQQAKVLLTQWARYRWGVWEEHGTPNSPRFPYFHRNLQQAVWETTGCSDAPLIGNYVDRYNEINEECNPEREEPLRSDCRFQPRRFGNNATTSLMHFHWLESVTHFCDETNHNQYAPNRQNVFCSYKSVWEVIKASTDYNAVTQQLPIEEGVPVTQFQTVKEQATPVLYVLLDKGQTQFPSMVNKVNNWISRLFDEPTPGTTLASLGTFPNPSSDFTSGRVIERVQWSTVDSSRSQLKTAVGLPSDGNPNRDFGLAIIEAAEAIKRKAPATGAVLLIVKTGAGENSFGDLAYEKQVFAALANERIKVFGLELKGENSKPYLNMGSFLASVGGIHTVVNSSSVDNPALFERLLADIRTALRMPVEQETSTETTIFKGFVGSGVRQTILVKPNLERMNFYLTAPAAADITFSTTPGTETQHGTPEWDETSDGQRRMIYPGFFVPSPAGQVNGSEWSLTVICHENCVNLRAHLLADGIYKAPDPESREETDPGTSEPEIEVFTSAIDRLVDLNATKDAYSPFTIFTKVRLNHQPVAGLKIQAHITSLVGNTNRTVQLVDDGLASPDIERENGIYSGTFIPESDGTYRITVQVKNDEIRVDPVLRMDTRLLPIDQTQFGCSEDENDGCGAVKLTKLYERSYDASDTITFINSETFVPGKPGPVLEAQVPDTSFGDIMLSFTTPQLLGTTGRVHIGYYVYVARDQSHILNHPKNGTLVDLRTLVGNKQPGEREELKVTIHRWHNEVVWIGLQGINWNNTNMKSDMSPLWTTNLMPGLTDPTETPITDEPTDDPSLTTESDGSTTELPEDSEKSFWKKTGGILTIIAIVLVALAIIGGGAWYCISTTYKKRKYSTRRRQREAQREQQRSASPPQPSKD